MPPTLFTGRRIGYLQKTEFWYSNDGDMTGRNGSIKNARTGEGVGNGWAMPADGGGAQPDTPLNCRIATAYTSVKILVW